MELRGERGKMPTRGKTPTPDSERISLCIVILNSLTGRGKRGVCLQNVVGNKFQCGNFLQVKHHLLPFRCKTGMNVAASFAARHALFNQY